MTRAARTASRLEDRVREAPRNGRATRISTGVPSEIKIRRSERRSAEGRMRLNVPVPVRLGLVDAGAGTGALAGLLSIAFENRQHPRLHDPHGGDADE